MPPRRSATTTVEKPDEAEETNEEKATVDKETIVGWVKEAVSEIFAKTGEDPKEVVPEEKEDPEEVESPRQQESRMRRAVESAAGELHIHVEQPKAAEPKKETEDAPGKPSWLQRFVGLS
jgi:hypothetical protein